MLRLFFCLVNECSVNCSYQLVLLFGLSSDILVCIHFFPRRKPQSLVIFLCRSLAVFICVTSFLKSIGGGFYVELREVFSSYLTHLNIIKEHY